MDKLKQLVASKRKAVEEEFGGKKFVKRGELEELRLKKLREQEEEERKQKVRVLLHLLPRPNGNLLASQLIGRIARSASSHRSA